MINIEDGRELRDYLTERLQSGAKRREVATNARFEILSGGVSNRTVRVAFPSGAQWVVKQALDKLRVPIDWFCSPERIHREALAIELLETILPRGGVPALIFEDRANYILAMEAVAEPFDNWKRVLLSGKLRLRTVRQFAELLAHIHVGGLRRRDGLPQELFDLTYFWNLRLEPYYRFTATRAAGARAMIERLAEGYEKRRLTLVHGDFSPKNVLLRRGRPILLDHEAMHVGDPAFDIGFSLTHLLSKAHHLAPLRSRFKRAALLYWSTYRAVTPSDAWEAWGSDFEQRSVCHTLGCLLARAAGRSQLEYLSEAEKERQARAVIELAAAGPRSIPELVEGFVDAVARFEAQQGQSGAGRTTQ